MAPKQAKAAAQRSAPVAQEAAPAPVTTAPEVPATTHADTAHATFESTDTITGRKLAYPLPAHISPSTINNTQSFLHILILGLISAAAIGSRLFAVIRFESVIHEL